MTSVSRPHADAWRALRRAVALVTAGAASVLGGCAGTMTADRSVASAAVASSAEVGKSVVRREEKVVKVALVLPLGAVGNSAALARSMKQAAEMALFDRSDLQFQITPYDDKGTPEGARAAAEAAKADGSELMLGPLFSSSVAAAAGVARPANIPLIAFSNDRQVAGRGVYLIGSLPDDEVRRIIQHVVANGKVRIAAFVPDDGYGSVVEAALRSAMGESGARLIAFEKYPLVANGAVEPARRLVERLKEAAENGLPADALFIPGDHETIANLSPLLTYAGLEPGKVQIIGTSGLDGGSIGRDPLLRGAQFAGPDPRGWQDFAIRFGKAFGGTPPRLAGLAFDAMTVAATLASEPPSTRYSTASITRPSGFQGIDGTIQFTAAGTARRSLSILELTETGTIVAVPGGTASGPAAAAAGVPQLTSAPSGLGTTAVDRVN